MKRHYQYDDQGGEKGDQQGPPMKNRASKSLCVSNIGPHIPDDILAGELQSTFSFFGDVNVKIAGYMGRRVAYLNFFDEKTANDAYERFLSKSIPLFHTEAFHSAHVEPVRASRPRGGRDNSEKTDRYNQSKTSGPLRRDMAEGKSHRYAHHLDKTLPEDDPNATRTLFIGNLDPVATREDIFKTFSPYGTVLDVDIKWSTPGSAGRSSQNPVCFAFLRFKTMDEAYAAKLGMSGQMLLSHTCKIGYGKIVHSACLWVGNISPSIEEADLQRDFAHFGQIVRFSLQKKSSSESYAVVLYDCNESASAAAAKMRAYRFPKTNRRLRIDFISPDEFEQYTSESADTDKMEQDSNLFTTEEESQSLLASIQKASSLTELFGSLPRIWSGQCLVKSSLFLSDFHGFAGDCEVVGSHLINNSAQLIKLGQRVSLSDAHLDELRRRCKAARGNYCVLLAAPSNDVTLLNRSRRTVQPNQQLTIRPLKALSLYLQSKSSMAIFMLQSSPFPTTVVLCYILPHCQYSQVLLKKHCPNLTFDREDSLKDDYLMVICFRSVPLHP